MVLCPIIHIALLTLLYQCLCYSGVVATHEAGKGAFWKLSKYIDSLVMNFANIAIEFPVCVCLSFHTMSRIPVESTHSYDQRVEVLISVPGSGTQCATKLKAGMQRVLRQRM